MTLRILYRSSSQAHSLNATAAPLHRSSEYSLVLEEIADALAQAKVPVTDQERGGMLALARTMKLDDLVPALGFCPRVG